LKGRTAVLSKFSGSLRATTVFTVLGGALVLGLTLPTMAADVTQERLNNADSEPQNWLTTFQNYQAHRYSRLDEINTENVSGLKVAFTLPITTGLLGRKNIDLESPPMVDDGIM